MTSSSTIYNLDLLAEHKIPNDLLNSTSLKTKNNESFVKVNEEVKVAPDRDTGEKILPLTNQSSNSEQNNEVKPPSSPQQNESTPIMLVFCTGLLQMDLLGFFQAYFDDYNGDLMKK